jgi:hypothetical protein
MIYELRTYMLKPGVVRDYETRFAEALPHREKYSKLGGFWHTDIGPLNQVVHLWPYEDLKHRTEVRAAAAKDPNWPPKARELYVAQETEILLPAPFMGPLKSGNLGGIYELRIYTCQVGSMPEVLKRWGEAVPHREKFSPLAGCWYTELGGLNKLIHLWPYADFAARARIREESSKGGHWPPQSREFWVRQENKMLLPADFSPMH